jgi:hypothetical protein
LVSRVAFGGPGDLADVVAGAGQVLGADRRGVEGFQQQFAVGGDHGEDVVEVVGHTPGELPEAFQPAGVLQAPFAGVAFGLGDQPFAFALGVQPFGDVTDGGGHDHALVGFQR